MCNHCRSLKPRSKPRGLEASLLPFCLLYLYLPTTLKGLNSFPDTRFFPPLLQSIYPLCVFVYFACVCTCQRWTTAAGAGAIQMKKKKVEVLKKKKATTTIEDKSTFFLFLCRLLLLPSFLSSLDIFAWTRSRDPMHRDCHHCGRFFIVGTCCGILEMG